MKLKKLIGNKAHWTINKFLVREMGWEATILLQHIIDLSESAFKKEQIFQPMSKMTDELCLSEHAIKKAIKILNDMDFINVERKGIPYKNYYSVNKDKIEDFLLSPASEVNSPNKPEIDSPASEVNSTQQRGENIPTSEVNSTQQQDEYAPAITNNTTNNTEEKYQTNNTTSKTEIKILENILDDLIQLKDERKWKSAFQEIKEYGGLDKVYETLNFDDSVIKNYNRQITSAYSIFNL